MIYISRSTFPALGNSSTVEPSVARILAKSRSNNRKKGLVGVLYFGDGCFFQCLEGNEKQVDALYETLLQDNRHKDLKILSRKMISQPSFSEWTMKYIALDTEVTDLMKKNGYEKFDPYQFDNEMTNKVLDLLHLANDSEHSSEDLKSGSVDKVNTQSDATYIAKWALFISIISAIVSSVALFR